MADRFDEVAAALVTVDECSESELFVRGAGLAEYCYSRANAEDVAAGARIALAALLREEAARARAEEREACAAICDAVAKRAAKHMRGPWDEFHDGAEKGAEDCAEAIRERGEP